MEKEQTSIQRFSTGAGIVIGGAGLVIGVDMVLTKMKKQDFPFLGFLAIVVAGAIGGGMLGNKLGNKWQASLDKKPKTTSTKKA